MSKEALIAHIKLLEILMEVYEELSKMGKGNSFEALEVKLVIDAELRGNATLH